MKKSVKASKKKGPMIKANNLSLQECLNNLNSNIGNIPLPGREEEIEKIYNFIEDSLTKKQFKILYISGSPGTGKTASVKHCINLASHPYEINFVNCKTEKPALIKPDDNPPKLLVLDEVESLQNYQDIVTNCTRYKCSILCISNAHNKTIAISKAHLSDHESIIFDSYKPDQLQNILIQRMGGPCNNIQESAIKYIANKVGQSHGDARTIISTMNSILTEAINRGLTNITAEVAVKMTNAQKEPDPVKDILENLGIKEQIALVAIFKSGSKWQTEFSNLSAQKKIKEIPNFVQYFDQLTSYGVISGTFKSPKCRVTKEQLKDYLDPIISVLI